MEVPVGRALVQTLYGCPPGVLWCSASGALVVPPVWGSLAHYILAGNFDLRPHPRPRKRHGPAPLVVALAASRWVWARERRLDEGRGSYRAPHGRRALLGRGRTAEWYQGPQPGAHVQRSAPLGEARAPPGRPEHVLSGRESRWPLRSRLTYALLFASQNPSHWVGGVGLQRRKQTNTYPYSLIPC